MNGLTGGCVWNLDDNGRLIIKPANGISGDLDMSKLVIERDYDGYEFGGTISPYAIKSLKIEDGVQLTPNGNMQFAELENCCEMDLSGLDTSKVINMSNMFSGCNSLVFLGDKATLAIQ